MMMLQTAVDQLLEGDVFGFVVDVFSASMPIPVLSLFVFGSIGMGYYIVQRSVAIPLVMFIIVGGVTIQRAPTVFQQGIIATAILAVAGIAFVIYNRVRA